MSDPDFSYYLTDFEADLPVAPISDTRLDFLSDNAAFNAITDWCHDNDIYADLLLATHRAPLKAELLERAAIEIKRRHDQYCQDWLNEHLPLAPEYACYANAK